MRPPTSRLPAQAFVEFALILPVMLVLTLGSFELGRAFVFGVAVQEGARESARLASTANYDASVDDSAILGRLIAASSPALGGGTLGVSFPQITVQGQSAMVIL